MTPLFIDEKHFKNEEAAENWEIAKCGECLVISKSELERQALTEEEAANLQWVRCAQCRAGTHDWMRK